MKSDGAVTGHYYYLANDDKMYLFVLNDAATKLINKGNLVRIKATLVEDEAASGFIEKEYTDAMNLGEEALDGYIESVIISQPDYPFVIASLRFDHRCGDWPGFLCFGLCRYQLL